VDLCDVTEDHATSPPVATRRPIGSVLEPAVYIEIRDRVSATPSRAPTSTVRYAMQRGAMSLV